MFLKLNCLLSGNIEFENWNKLISNSCMKITLLSTEILLYLFSLYYTQRIAPFFYAPVKVNTDPPPPPPHPPRDIGGDWLWIPYQNRQMPHNMGQNFLAKDKKYPTPGGKIVSRESGEFISCIISPRQCPGRRINRPHFKILTFCSKTEKNNKNILI
jgi:hypothetical protein